MSNFLFETERLAFRNFVLEDAQLIFRLNSDPEVIKYTGNVPCKNLAEARKVITGTIHKQYKENEFGRWAVVLKSAGDVIGWCGIRYKKERRRVDLGYRFLRKYWGNGIATEAAGACLEFGFSNYNLDSIIALAQPQNAGSVRVLEKIGMNFTKKIIEDGAELVWYEKKAAAN